jgi:hypothetical protein
MRTQAAVIATPKVERRRLLFRIGPDTLVRGLDFMKKTVIAANIIIISRRKTRKILKVLSMWLA